MKVSSVLQMFHEVNKRNCQVEYSKLHKTHWIGQTRNSTSRRMSEHLQNGALKELSINDRENVLTGTDNVKKFSCIKRFNNVEEQKLYESLIIMKENLSINKLYEDFSNALKLH